MGNFPPNFFVIAKGLIVWDGRTGYTGSSGPAPATKQGIYMAKWHKMALAAALGLAVVSAGGYALAQADVIKERKEGFKGNKDAAEAIKKVVDAGGPAADVVAPAQKIADWATKIPAHFPKGSDQGDTKAKPDIWANWDDFTKDASNNHEAALKLVAAGKSGDMGAVKAAFGALGATCGACHKQFKEK